MKNMKPNPELLYNTIRFVLSAEDSDFKHSIKGTQFTNRDFGLNKHFVAKYKGHLSGLPDVPYIEACAFIHAMFAWSDCYTNDWQRTLVNEANEEWNACLRWMFNYLENDLLTFQPHGRLYYFYLRKMNMELPGDTNGGGVQAILLMFNEMNICGDLEAFCEWIINRDMQANPDKYVK